MELTNDFRVALPVERAWAVLTDLEQIAPCMPGAQLQEVEGDEYRGVVKIKVGPITAQYKGQATFLERDEVNHVAVLRAEGRETRGQGNANATITATLTPDGDGTAVSVVTDLTVTGRVAQFGRGVLADVSAKLLGQFVESLERTVLADDSATPTSSAEPAAPPVATALSTTDGTDASGTTASSANAIDATAKEAPPKGTAAKGTTAKGTTAAKRPAAKETTAKVTAAKGSTAKGTAAKATATKATATKATAAMGSTAKGTTAAKRPAAKKPVSTESNDVPSVVADAAVASTSRPAPASQSLVTTEAGPEASSAPTAPVERPAVRRIDSPEPTPVNLLDAAGSPLAKRVGPVLAAVAVLWLLRKLLSRARR